MPMICRINYGIKKIAAFEEFLNICQYLHFVLSNRERCLTIHVEVFLLMWQFTGRVDELKIYVLRSVDHTSTISPLVNILVFLI